MNPEEMRRRLMDARRSLNYPHDDPDNHIVGLADAVEELLEVVEALAAAGAAGDGGEVER